MSYDDPLILLVFSISTFFFPTTPYHSVHKDKCACTDGGETNENDVCVNDSAGL